MLWNKTSHVHRHGLLWSFSDLRWPPPLFLPVSFSVHQRFWQNHQSLAVLFAFSPLKPPQKVISSFLYPPQISFADCISTIGLWWLLVSVPAILNGWNFHSGRKASRQGQACLTLITLMTWFLSVHFLLNFQRLLNFTKTRTKKRNLDVYPSSTLCSLQRRLHLSLCHLCWCVACAINIWCQERSEERHRRAWWICT